jgi:FkbM family methyltransferase
MGVASAIATNTENITPQNYDRFRHKTALWIDESFFKILSGCGVTGLIECGAHEASASINFMRTGGRRAVAIEANPITYEMKTKLAEQHGVLSFNCGVGKEVGEIDFFIPQHDQTAGNASFLKKPNVNYESKKVSVDTINNIFHKHFKRGEVLALWIDVEGLALDVLKGGDSLLKNDICQVIKVEVENIPFWQNQSLARDVDNYLTSLDYKAILRDIEWNGQYNLIYVKEKYIDCIDDILIDCWRELAWLKISRSEKIDDWRKHSHFRTKCPDRINNPRELLVYVKYWLTRSDESFLSIFTHNIAALLGSKSSKKFLKIHRSCK